MCRRSTRFPFSLRATCTRRSRLRAARRFALQGAPIEQYGYLIIARGSIELHFFDQPGVDPLTTDAGCHVRVRDADELHREWKALGVPADPTTGSRLMGVRDTDYGLREFALVDPSGNLMRVGSPRRTTD